jgi:type I restriction enzyme S subunit
MTEIPELSFPESWSRATLADVRRDDTTILNPAKHPEERFELYSIPAHETGKPELLRGRDIGSAKKMLSPDTVLLSKINPRINRVWVVGDANGVPQIGSSEWIAFSPIEGIVPRYLAHYLRQDRFCTYLASNVSGVGGSLMRVKPAVVERFPFVFPPSGEQQRIVEAVDSFLTRLNAAVASLERVQAKLKAYRASVLKAAVEGRLVPTEASLARAEERDYEPADVLLARILKERRRRWEESELAKLKAAGKTPRDDKWKAKYEEPIAPDTSKLPGLREGWCWATVDQLSVVVRGASPRPAGDPRYFGGSVYWITVGSLTADDEPYLRHVSESLTEAGRRASRFVEPGTLLLTNSGATLGVPKITLIGGCINDGSVALLHVQDPTKLYLYFFLKSLTEKLRSINQGAAQPNLNTGIVRRISVSVPPLSEQSRIATELERLVSVATAIEADVVAGRRRALRLRQAVLKWAFEGKLVDQDPGDEPADGLLARIRAERVVVEPRKKSRSRAAKGAA